MYGLSGKTHVSIGGFVGVSLLDGINAVIVDELLGCGVLGCTIMVVLAKVGAVLDGKIMVEVEAGGVLDGRIVVLGPGGAGVIVVVGVPTYR